MNLFKTAGRLYGRLLATETGKTAARGAETLKKTVIREAETARLRLRAALLRQKRSGHLALLGKRVYRLAQNGEDPLSHPQVREIIRVLGMIDAEIAATEAELDIVRAAPR